MSGPLAILGGTFDPIHLAHLRLAEEVADALPGAEVRLVPAGQPPHRAAPGASAAERLAMAQLAVAGNPRLSVDASEVQAAGRSYTIDTLGRLRAAIGPTRPLCLVVGADAFLGLPTWHRWTELLAHAHIVVATRPGYDVAAALPDALAPLWRQSRAEHAAALASAPAGRILPLTMTPLAIAASDIRELLRAGRSIRYLVPDAVAAHIEARRLYR